MKGGSNQSAKKRSARRFLINMERLRIKFFSKIDNSLLCHHNRLTIDMFSIF